MNTTRLRQTFRYPDDSDDDANHAREELDEEEQEQVIRQLQMQNDRRNAEYRTMFTILPLCSIIVFLPSIFSRSSTLWEAFISFISVLSLMATAYVMKYHPPRHPDPKGKRPIRNPDLHTWVEEFLPATNAAISGTLATVYLLSCLTGLSWGNPSFTYIVPGVMLTTTAITRRVMASVDLRYLENLRYDYKGA